MRNSYRLFAASSNFLISATLFSKSSFEPLSSALLISFQRSRALSAKSSLLMSPINSSGKPSKNRSPPSDPSDMLFICASQGLAKKRNDKNANSLVRETHGDSRPKWNEFSRAMASLQKKKLPCAFRAKPSELPSRSQ